MVRSFAKINRAVTRENQQNKTILIKTGIKGLRKIVGKIIFADLYDTA